MKNGILLVISGPAGSGKGTVIKRLLEEKNYAYSVSATTRAPRDGETDGVSYHFISREEFEARVAAGEMLEHTEYCENYYGTPLREAQEVLNAGRNLILEIEVEGAMNVKKLYPEAVLILLLPPTFEVQAQRLRGRGTETEAVIAKRLERTREELTYAAHYDYVVYNEDDGVEQCVRNIRAIACAESCSMRRHPDTAIKYFT